MFGTRPFFSTAPFLCRHGSTCCCWRWWCAAGPVHPGGTVVLPTTSCGGVDEDITTWLAHYGHCTTANAWLTQQQRDMLLVCARLSPAISPWPRQFGQPHARSAVRPADGPSLRQPATSAYTAPSSVAAIVVRGCLGPATAPNCPS